MNVQAKDIAEIMGGKQVLGREVRDFADLDAVVEAGLPVAVVETLRQHLGSALGSSSKRILSARMPSRNRSRVIERIARMFAASERTFGSEDGAREFLLAPHARLGCKRPIDCVETELAFKQVEQILESITFGLPA